MSPWHEHVDFLSDLEIIVLVIRILTGTFAAVFLISSLLVFRLPNEKGEEEMPMIAWIPLLDIIWAIVAPIAHWKENKAGRICIYGLGVSTLIFTATFLIQ